MKNYHMLLKQAREKIAKGWTPRCWARNDSGAAVMPSDPSAVCWCITGALSGSENRHYNDAVNALERVVGVGVIEWNDEPGRTQAEVLKAFDRAIAATAG